MGTNISAPKKERNYLIELMKVFWAFLVVVIHVSAQILGPLGLTDTAAVRGATNPAVQYSFFYNGSAPLLGMSGTLTIGIFLFLSGYAIVNEFKKNQRRGVIGKGKNAVIVGKLAVKNWSAYVPYLFFGTLYGFVLYHVLFPAFRDIKVVAAHFVTSFLQFVGLYGAGDNHAFKGAQQVVGLTAEAPNTVISSLLEYDGPLWYMFALVWCGVMMYAMLVASENITLFLAGPLMWSVYTCLGGSATVMSNIQSLGIYIRWPILMGMMMLGVWGWYCVDWLKKLEVTKKGKAGLTVLVLVIFALFVHNLIFYYGGMNLTDIFTSILAVLVLAQKDYVTVGINKFLNKLPFMKYCSNLSLAMYVMHFPTMCAFRVMVDYGEYKPVTDWLLSHTNDQIILIMLGLTLIMCIPFFIYDKFCAKKFIAWFHKISKCTEPVVIEAPKAEA